MLIATLVALASVSAVDDLEELEARLKRTKDPDERIAILDEIAVDYERTKSDAGHADLVISVLLGDDKTEVRVHAAELLGARLDDDVAIEGMVRAVDETKDADEDLLKELEKATERTATELEKKDPDYVTLFELLGAQAEALGKLKGLEAIRVALGRSLAQHSDDRCVDGLGVVLPRILHREESLELVDALLGYGTRPALGAVVATFEGLDELRDNRDRWRKRIAKEKARPKPRSYAGNNTQWRKAEKKRLKKKLADYDAETDALEKRMVLIAKRTSTFAKEHGLQKAPRNARATNWTGWWERNRELLPESLKDR